MPVKSTKLYDVKYEFLLKFHATGGMINFSPRSATRPILLRVSFLSLLMSWLLTHCHTQFIILMNHFPTRRV